MKIEEAKVNIELARKDLNEVLLAIDLSQADLGIVNKIQEARDLLDYALGYLEEKKMGRKGHSFFPWWFLPASILWYPIALIKEWISKRKKNDPHDISGEV